jgi:thiamine-phosphate pyrophosphorylase
VRPPRLMYVTDPSSSRHDVVAVARAAVDGGADCVQARGAATDRELHDLAAALVQAVGARALVLVNDRFDVALAAGAAGVHLKDSGLPAARIRRAATAAGAPADFVVGQSAHSADGLRRAAREDAAPVTLGPLHAAHGRDGVGAPALAAWLQEARQAGELPASVLLLGGAGLDDAVLARSLQGPGECVGLAAIRLFQDAPTLDEVRRRAAAVRERLEA